MKDMRLKKVPTLGLRTITKEISKLLFSEVKDTISTVTCDVLTQVLVDVKKEIQTRPDRNVSSTFIEEEA